MAIPGIFNVVPFSEEKPDTGFPENGTKAQWSGDSSTSRQQAIGIVGG
jgi:hypothetical protein